MTHRCRRSWRTSVERWNGLVSLLRRAACRRGGESIPIAGLSGCLCPEPLVGPVVQREDDLGRAVLGTAVALDRNGSVA